MGALFGSKTTQTTSRNLLPEQTRALGSVGDYIQRLLTDPSAGLAPLQSAARNKVNDAYSGGWQGLRDKLLASGGTASGKFGTAARQMEMGRLSSLAGLEPQFAAQILGQQNTGASLAQTLLGQNFGSTSSMTSTPSLFSSLLSVGGLLAGIPGLGGGGGGGAAAPPVSNNPWNYGYGG